jgi:hypothetical protein
MGGISGLEVATYMNMGVIHADPADPTADYDVMPCVRTETLDISPAEIEANCRNSGDWEQALGGLLSGELSFTYLYSKTDPQFIALRDAALNPRDTTKKPQIAVMFATGDFAAIAPGEEGFVAVMTVTGFSINRDYDSAVEVTVTMKPYNDTATPAPPLWWTVPTP